MLLAQPGQTDTAREACTNLLAKMERALAPQHPQILYTRFLLGHIEVEARRHEQALAAVEPGAEACA